MPPEQAMKRIVARMAPGIIVHLVTDIPLGQASLQAQTESATYEVTLLDELDNMELAARIQALLAEGEIRRERRGKAYDLRPQILSLQLARNETGQALLHMKLTLLPGQTGRPDEVLMALGLEPTAAILSGLALAGPSSVSTTMGSPLRWGISMGTISSLKAPASIALIARWVDSRA